MGRNNEFFENFEKKNKNLKKLPSMQRVKTNWNMEYQHLLLKTNIPFQVNNSSKLQETC